MKKITRGLLLLILATPCAGDTLRTGSADGQVLDYETGRPIEGAIVAGLWRGDLFQIVQSQSVCVHAETAVSDANGRYHIDAWAGPTVALGVGLFLDAYKPGYVSAGAPLQYQKQIDRQGRSDGTWVIYKRGHPYEVLQTFPDEKSAKAATHPNNLYLKPFGGTANDRIEYLWGRVFSGMNCHGAGASLRNLYSLQRAAYQEAKPLATTAAQQKTLRFMRKVATDSWLALRTDEPEPEKPEIPEQVRRDLE